MEVFLIIICVVIVFIAIISISNNSSRKEALNSEVQKISENGFVADKKFVSKDSKASLMIDSKNKKVAVSAANINGAKIQVYDDFVCNKIIENIQFELSNYYAVLIDKQNRKILLYSVLQESMIPNDINSKIINFDELKGVEMIINNAVVSKKSILRTIGGAAIGDAVAGDAGAVVGGLSGGEKSVSAITLIQMRILLKNIDTPSYTFTCVKCEPLPPDNWTIKRHVQMAYSVRDTLNAIIDMINDENKAYNQEYSQPSTDADEIMKLSELLKSGAITEEEFKSLKAKIINKYHGKTIQRKHALFANKADLLRPDIGRNEK